MTAMRLDEDANTAQTYAIKRIGYLVGCVIHMTFV